MINKKQITYSLQEIVSIFTDSTNFDLKSVKFEKKWIDGYNTQIERVIRGRNIEELTQVERRVLNILLHKIVYSYWKYILKKHCK